MIQEVLEEEKKKIFIWFLFCSLAICNVVIWYNIYQLVIIVVDDSRMMNETAIISLLDYYQTYNLILSGIYLFACTHRYIIPHIDLENYRLVGSFFRVFSSVDLSLRKFLKIVS